MKFDTFLKGLAAAALLSATGVAHAVHEVPSPCDAGEISAGTSCVYMAQAGNTYNAGTGERTSAPTAMGASVQIQIYMDFEPEQTSGGGFDISYDNSAITSASFSFDGSFLDDPSFRGDGGANPNGFDDNPNGSYQGIGFGNFNGMGGEEESTCCSGFQSPGFQLIGTLTVQLAAGFSGLTTLSFVERPVPEDQRGAPSGFVDEVGQDMDANFFDFTIDVQAVPLPAAVWMMMGGLGFLFGFGRKKA